MPGLNTQIMLATARNRSSGFHLRLPTVVGGGAPPLLIGAAGGLSSTSGRQHIGEPNASSPVELFQAASGDARDIEMKRRCNNALDNYLRRICDAIGQAHTVWSQRATLVDVIINAVTASGGRLLGAGLEADIRQRGPLDDSWRRPRTEAIAAGIGFCWDNWQRTVTVPGMPWYPAFASFPGPMAPPMPNIPVPLIALRQNPLLLNYAQVKALMLSRYSGDKEWPGELFEAVAAGMERAFQTWAPTQMVRNVLGTGPVPTFAPPYVPVGPVVNGRGTQTPGAWSV